MAWIEVQIDIEEHLNDVCDTDLIDEIENRDYKVMKDSEAICDMSKLSLLEKDNLELFIKVFRNINQASLEGFLKTQE